MPVYPYALDRPAHPTLPKRLPRLPAKPMPLPSQRFMDLGPRPRLVADSETPSGSTVESNSVPRTVGEANALAGGGFAGLMNRLNSEAIAPRDFSPSTSPALPTNNVEEDDNLSAGEDLQDRLDDLKAAKEMDDQRFDELEEWRASKQAVGGGGGSDWNVEMSDTSWAQPQSFTIRPRYRGRRRTLNRG